MVFVLAQSLDNRSPDLCVWRGQLIQADAPQAQTAQDIMWAIQANAKPFQLRHTTIYAAGAAPGGPGDVVFKVDSPDLDSSGRASPVLLLTDTHEVTRPNFAASVVVAALQLNRQVPADDLTRDVETWLDRARKGKSGWREKAESRARAVRDRTLGRTATPPSSEEP